MLYLAFTKIPEMKDRLIIAFFSLFLIAASQDSTAQELVCHRAIKKDMKADKKESKIRRKMFHDREHKASRKNFKAFKKDCKSEGKEFKHSQIEHHDGPAE
jgi:hypothetical protein